MKSSIIQQAGTIATLAAGALFASSVVAQELPQDGVYKDRIDWGVLMDLSGPTAGSQGVWTNGFQDHMRKVNESGGVNGRKINVLAEDNRFNAATDKIAFEKLVGQTPVLGISGMGSSASQVGLANTIRNGKVPVVATYTSTKALSEPASPMVYNGFCAYKQMAQAGVGYMVESMKLRNPKVVTLAIETAGGKEYHDYVEEAIKKSGGTAHHVTMKVTAVDMTPQLLEIANIKPDFITVYGVNNSAILAMKGMQQQGMKIPTFGITYLGAPTVFQAMGPEAGANYRFISCFTPGGADASAGNREMSAFADKVGRSAMKEDINYVAGWVAGQMVVDQIAKLGPNPSRARLVEVMSKGFAVDTKGLTGPITFSTTDHLGPQVFKMFSYDYAAKKFKSFGDFSDYLKYTR